jgi:hypothetical protein
MLVLITQCENVCSFAGSPILPGGERRAQRDILVLTAERPLPSPDGCATAVLPRGPLGAVRRPRRTGQSRRNPWLGSAEGQQLVLERHEFHFALHNARCRVGPRGPQRHPGSSRRPQNALCIERSVNAWAGPAACHWTWPQLTVGGELGPARNRPYTLRWERPDAERQPTLCALRSSPAGIATVSRGARPRRDVWHHRHNLRPPPAEAARRLLPGLSGGGNPASPRTERSRISRPSLCTHAFSVCSLGGRCVACSGVQELARGAGVYRPPAKRAGTRAHHPTTRRA